jgi:peroxiredoxin Q/BCP
MLKTILILSLLLCTTSQASANELKVGDNAPTFSTKVFDGSNFDLNSRKGLWTVLYFYPKAGTPGCTKQACGFRDNIEKIRKLDAEVFGVSADTMEAQAKFHSAQHLNFPLLADPDSKIVNLYGTKMPVIGLSKRWTFIIDPTLKIRSIDKDVDPVLDAKKVAASIAAMKNLK